MLTVACITQKGGAGKTMLATNLAAAGHLAGLRTLVVDLDIQGSAIDWAAERDENPASPLAGIAVRSLAGKAPTLPTLRELGRGRDLVIYDGPPRLGDLTLVAAIMADVVVLPFCVGAADWWAYKHMKKLLEEADAFRAELQRPQPPVRRIAVLNLVARPQAHVTQAALDSLRGLGGELAPLMGYRVALVSSFAAGASVLTQEPQGAASGEIRKLFTLITGKETP